MHISLDTSEEISALDKSILNVLAGNEKTSADAPVAQPPAAAKKTAAPKETVKEEPDEDLVGDDAPTMDDAKALATKMVSAGEAAKVKSALADVGAKKVSEIPEDKVAEFIAALS